MFDKYSLKNGEDLERIAKRFNTDPKTLKEINNIYFDDQFRAGKDVIVPKNQEQYFNYYIIEKGDSLYGIARKYNINPDLLASMNGLEIDDYIYPNQEILIPKSGYSYYITKEGDSLNTVADVFKISQEKLLNDNSTIYLLSGQIMIKKNN